MAISAAYGAAGSLIGSTVAERLGVPFVERGIPMAVAERLEVPLDDALAHDEQPAPSLLERLLAGFHGGEPLVAPLPAESVTAEDFHRASEEVLRQQAATGSGVILGRGAVAALREDPRVLRVRLTGSPETRERWATKLGRVDEATARAGRRGMDQAQAEYLRRFYGVRIEDPDLYHLVLDAPSVGLAVCVEIITCGARAFVGAPSPG